MIDLLKILKNDSKNREIRPIIIYKIEIDIQNFSTKLENNQLKKIIIRTNEFLAKQSAFIFIFNF